MTIKDEPAFPIRSGYGLDKGVTKREYFAALAMQGLLARVALPETSREELSKDACYLADALIEQLEKLEEK